ncbi:MAG: bifunctional rRNA ((2069)-N(7))-methyltransferase RlmK/23S rRNA, partial [Pseudomonadota bacterium]
MSSVLRQAWALRAPSFSPSGALRLFYGPGEVSPGHPLAAWAVDGYGAYLWVTEWEGPHAPLSLEELSQITRDFYEPLGFVGAIVLTRPRQGVPDQPRVLWGQTPPKAFGVYERWGEVALEYEIRLLESRHPGLFLDHEPLRRWLACSGQMQGRSVLNTFAYTGSLSVAAWRGGARSVTTVDLSRPTLDWAKRNAEINGGMACGGLTESSATPESQSRFFVGDFFEQIPRLARRGERF